MQARRRAGLSSFPCRLLQDQLVHRQVRHRPPQPGVLCLQSFQALDLVAPQAAIFLAPAVVRHLADPDRADRIRYALALRGQNINLAQLGDNLVRFVRLP